MPSGSIQAIPPLALAHRLRRPYILVSMPSGSIQAIPPVCRRCPRRGGGRWFQCHLVRFKLFRAQFTPAGPRLTPVSMPSGSIQAIPPFRAPLPAPDGANRFNAIWFDSSYSAKTFFSWPSWPRSVSMPSGSIQAIPQPERDGGISFPSSFQCHLVRFKLFRPRSSLRAPQQTTGFNAIWFDSSYSAAFNLNAVRSARAEFQCHLVRFKLFRLGAFSLDKGGVFVSMPSGSIQAIPLFNSLGSC